MAVQIVTTRRAITVMDRVHEIETEAAAKELREIREWLAHQQKLYRYGSERTSTKSAANKTGKSRFDGMDGELRSR